MPMPVRISLLACCALLVACAGSPPQVSHEHSRVVAFSPMAASGTAEDVLFSALGLVGTPYRWGGNTPESGFDCSGLIGYVYRGAAGVVLPRTTQEMMGASGARVGRDALRSGDLLFFATNGGRRVSHAGIYVGDGRFVHAPSSGGTVRLDSLSNNYWHKSYIAAKRVLGAESLASNP
ncbi:C40 family peptidase [Stutzerimonas kirkiae]|uniref:Hydrolase Nlp/P60 n=1 Tax=Stutzerimonas kirkiae TaxID=2211392 RepID=A0A4Q9RB22_9GAMM|nr:C40 family peptidase [Stutzerimonas kirkiae]TBU98055.1 hydrolase Nlp/P60 [Stutzerimonas kirkiae]TBV02924.1 hydrolase Nlp/P60 [Stutzerimonas kirkiae]TBV11106.1 hydrolase Nlp/P60 [Stutzerimonas kirkiae]TBV13025.1 hydrolase Nlp/P60 [Stutzerimonas kirkiae]